MKNTSQTDTNYAGYNCEFNKINFGTKMSVRFGKRAWMTPRYRAIFDEKSLELASQLAWSVSWVNISPTFGGRLAWCWHYNVGSTLICPSACMHVHIHAHTQTPCSWYVCMANMEVFLATVDPVAYEVTSRRHLKGMCQVRWWIAKAAKNNIKRKMLAYQWSSRQYQQQEIPYVRYSRGNKYLSLIPSWIM